MSFDKVVQTARDAFNSGMTRDISFRQKQLDGFMKMIEECADDILACLNKEMRKSKLEGSLYELEVLKADAIKLRNFVGQFAEDEKLPVNLLASLDSAYIKKQPYGVVLILGAWNYPFLLSLQPVLGAIAAGNCVILKPSEVAPHSARLMSQLLPRYLDPKCYQVVQADVEETKKLLTYKFDYIFCTGSTGVGRSVMEQAAKHLTPVTLELGGKSPCYVDETADFDLAAKRILWGKFMNLGQTCIAPDYILCSKAAEESFVKVANKVIYEWYGSDLKNNPDMTRIINKKHFNRLKKLLGTTKGKIVFGGHTDEADLFIEPTIVVDVKADDALMEDELFGPICPIVTVNSPEEAIAFINSKPRPLALYSFAKNDAVNKKMVDETCSGGCCINDVMWHMAWTGLPFGGVGNSGMGNYHGKFSFDTFSHHRGVLNRSFSWLSEKLGEARYPPYTPGKLKFFKMILSNFERCNLTFGPFFTHGMASLVGALAVLIFFMYLRPQ